MRCYIYIATLLATSMLSGCTILNGAVNARGANVIFEEDSNFDKINLYKLLDPSSELNSEGLKGETVFERSHPIEPALHAFYAKVNALPSEEQKKLERNRVQDRIIHVSNQRCRKFQSYLHQYEGETNFLFGTFATAFAGAGAVLQHAQTAQEFAAASSLFSGVRAEFNNDFFRKVTIELIVKGIDARRRNIQQTIDQSKTQTLTDYTVERAIGDALEYHGNCTVVAGLLEAGDAIVKQEALPGTVTFMGEFNRLTNNEPQNEVEKLRQAALNSNPLEVFYNVKNVTTVLKSKIQQLQNTTIAAAEAADIRQKTDVLRDYGNSAQGLLNRLTSSTSSGQKTTIDTTVGQWLNQIAEIEYNASDADKPVRIAQLKQSLAQMTTLRTELSALYNQATDLIQRIDPLLKKHGS